MRGIAKTAKIERTIVIHRAETDKIAEHIGVNMSVAKIPVEVGVRIRKEVHEVFMKDSGGSNRTWVRRYRNMIQHYEYLKKNATNKKKRDELRGYEECMKNFYTATGKNSVLKQ